MARRLGSTQSGVLRSLVELGGWERRCGWVWWTERGTERILDRLVELGFAARDAKGAYTATEAGEAEAARAAAPLVR